MNLTYEVGKTGLDIGLAPWRPPRQPGPMMAPPSAWPRDGPPVSPAPHHTPTAPQPTFNLISINYDNVWLHSLNVVEGWMLIGKNSLNNFICHLSWLKKLSPTHTHPLISIHEFSKPCKLLFFELESPHKMLNVNWEKIHSIILCVTCHGFRNFPLLIHIPSKPFMDFWNPASYYFLS